MNGKEVFEKLESMTDAERERCVFPGFFWDWDYDATVENYVNNTYLDDDEYEMVINTPNRVVAKLMQKVVDDHLNEWCSYVDALYSDLMGKVIEAAKASKK